jgi:hypothetical protein
MLLIQFQNIKDGSIDQFRDLKAEVLLYPPQYMWGDIIAPYETAKKSGLLATRWPRGSRARCNTKCCTADPGPSFLD